MRRRALAGDADGLAAELRAIRALKYEDLRRRFLALYGAQPPPRLGRDLLLRAIAYRATMAQNSQGFARLRFSQRIEAAALHPVSTQ